MESARADVVHISKPSSGGVRRHFVDLIHGLHERGVRQALIYAPADADAAFGRALKEFSAMGVPAFSVEMIRRIDPRADFRAGREIVRIVRGLRPDILHLHSSKAGGIVRLGALALRGMRIVYTPHGSAANISRVYQRIEQVLGRIRVDRVVAVSGSERAELARLRIVPESKLVQVDCGLDTAEVRAAAGAPLDVTLPDGPLLVASGRLSQQKNPEHFVEVARILSPRFPDLRFVWLGDGEERDAALRAAVEARIEGAGLRDRWTLTGWMANPFPVFHRAAVYAMTSRYESFGYTTLEAMVLGKPVVSNDITGSRDLVVPGETGYLVPPDDPTAFADAVSRLLRDPELAARMGAAGAERAEHFSRGRMATEMLQVYRSLGLRPGTSR